MVGVVRAPDDPVGADEGHQGRQGPLVDLEADPALAGEVLARAQRHVRAEAAEGLRLLVEALEPEREPAAARLQEDHLQPGVAVEDAEGDQLGVGQHLLEGVRRGVEDERVEGPVGAEGGDDHRAALVDADRPRPAPRPPPTPGRYAGSERARPRQGLGRTKAARNAELVHCPAQLGRRRRRVLHGQHGRAEQPRPERPRSSRPASRCRPGRWPRPPPGRRAPRSRDRPRGRARPGRCPRCPCRPAGPPDRTRRAGPPPAE